MGKTAVFVLAGLAGSATATLADGFELTMQWTDSLTVEGTRYTCNGPARGGVAMAPGDRISAGQLRLRCAKRDNGGAPDGPPGPPPPPPATTTVTSTVDLSCLAQLNTAISGRLPGKDAAAWADACRALAIPRSCTITSTTPQPRCVDTLDSMISGSFTADQVIEVQRACSTQEGACTPRGTRKVAIATDMACMTQLFQKTSGRPTAASIGKWFDACRPAVQGRCVTVAATFDTSCFSQAFQFISGRPNALEAAGFARNCTKLELRCD